MFRVMFRCDLRDWSTLIFTFIFPMALLLILVFSMKGAVPGLDLTSQISANVIAFGAAYVGIFAGATHLATWRENGMLRVLRNFPLSSNVIILSQAFVGVVFLLAQGLVLTIMGVVLGMVLKPTALLGLLPLVFGYLFFFFLGVIIALLVPSMAGVSMLANIIILPLGFAGGAMMPVEMLPSWMQTIAPYTPIYHMREALSMMLIGSGTWPHAWLGLVYLAIGCIPLGLISVYGLRWK
ncbi:ABC transporter permease [Bombiscardovia coagulans]|nr:ABC transporter permease [Bombiscardovia coagulans]